MSEETIKVNNVADTAKDIRRMVTSVKRLIPSTNTILSTVVAWTDNANSKVPFIKQEIRNICSKQGLDYINHTNISTDYLERNNTLNPKETQILAANICTYLKHI